MFSNGAAAAGLRITIHKANYFGGLHLENPALDSFLVDNPFDRVRWRSGYWILIFQQLIQFIV
jgi:hypothetical protein